MAFIGARHVVVAELDHHTPGEEPVYKAGMDLGPLVNANLTINRNTNPLYGDDVLDEDDNGITSMELELEATDIDEAVEAYIGLVETKTTGAGSDEVTTYYDTNKPSKRVGVGYMRVRRKKGKTIYQGVWGYSTRFGKGNETAKTKGENIEWQTTTIKGALAALRVDASDAVKFRKKQNFSDPDACSGWLDEIAGIVRA